MDCFKVKLLLRNGYHSQEQDYPLHAFEHLFLCRSCWAYANYLWHREAQEVGRKQPGADAEHRQRLERAWSARRTLGKGGLVAWSDNVLSRERKQPH